MPSLIPRSRHKGEWVFLQFSPDEGWCKAKIRKVCREAGSEAYEVQWEDGEIEAVFVASIFRIRSVHPRKGRVIDFAKRRAKLGVVKCNP